MDAISQNKLKIMHIGADPEFDSHVVFENYQVEIMTADNPFTASLWISDNGLPDGVICERTFSGSNVFGFYDFWIEQFDMEGHVPFIMLDDEKNQETRSMSIQEKMDDVYLKPTKIETLISRILSLKETKLLTDIQSDSLGNSFTPYETPFSKRITDIVLASIGLLIISPVIILFNLAIRLESKGRAYYISKRVGLGYKVFNFYKMRSMYANADRRLKELAHLNQYHKTTFDTFDDDRRITKVGYIIRKLRIDELPQLLNVLKGDMSIVGNRPLPIYEAELLTIDDLTDRLKGPAGITGLWLVDGSSKSVKMSSEKRKSLDNKYFEIAKSPFSFWKDIWIILRTIPTLFQKKNQ